MTFSSKRIAVVGGGIAGLAAAHRLTEIAREKNLALEIILIEARERLGGAIATERVDGFVVESGPDSFISAKPWALALCERLGLRERLISTNRSRQTVLVVRNGRAVPLPEGFLLMAPTRLLPLMTTPLFSLGGKLRMAAEYFMPRGAAREDESLASFVTRRFGREALERVVQPLIGGIYAADPEKLSLAATMPRFLEMEQARGSVIKGMLRERRQSPAQRADTGARWSLFLSLAGGMQELVDAIAARLPEGCVRTGTRVTGVSWDATTKSWTVSGESGITNIDGVILAAPAYAAAGLIGQAARPAARALNGIPYTSTATVSLAYREADVPRDLGGFGMIVPAIEKRNILACTFSSMKYAGRAPAGAVLLRAFVGGALQPELFDQDDAAMEASVQRELKELLGIDGRPMFTRVHRHPRAMPQYPVGHLASMEWIEEELKSFPTLRLAGNAYYGVGIADCVHSGETAAEAIVEALATAPL
ncbi:MAG TPA: protoporphyrinogen oxidase [Candidatus Binatia bacterium]|jgi:oxygen-dependent protoporphyrinogen oxidase